MTCGIYQIKNKINGHMYIGLSKNIEHRFNDHKTKPFSSNKPDDINKALYKAIRKYGVHNFEFNILEECLESELKDKEIYWISYYNTYEDRQHYNETPGGDLPCENTVHLGEEHGMAKLTTQDVIFCRESYRKGYRSRDIWEKYFSTKISYSGFLRMWHGQNWKHIMPEVFNNNPHPAKYGERDCEIISQLFEESHLSLSAFVKSEECYVGYGTAWKMIHNPEFYKGK